MPEWTWLLAYHEASHMVTAWLHGSTCEYLRLGVTEGPNEAHYTWPTWMERERLSLVKCLTALAGVEGQWIFGELPEELWQSDVDGGDWRQFERDRKHAYLIQDWPDGKAVVRALRPIVADLLKANDRLVYALANYAVGYRHCFGDDCERLLKDYQRMFGITPSLLMRPDWRTAFRLALEAQARRQR